MGLTVDTTVDTPRPSPSQEPDTSSSPAVRLSAVRKTYGEVVAVEGEDCTDYSVWQKKWTEITA